MQPGGPRLTGTSKVRGRRPALTVGRSGWFQRGSELHQSSKKTHHIYNSVFDDISYFYLQVWLDPSVTSDPTATSSRGFSETQGLTLRKSGKGKTGS